MKTRTSMKSLKRLTCACLAAATIMTPLAAPVTAQAAAPKLSKSQAVLTVGSKMTLKIKNVKKGTAVKWSSTKKAVATVTAKGVVTAKAAGKTTIKAVVNKKTLSCKITVKEKAASDTNTDVNQDANTNQDVNTDTNSNNENKEPGNSADTDKTNEADPDTKDVSASLAGKTYKGTADTPIGKIEAVQITFKNDGTAAGFKLSETTMMKEEFSGVYQAILKDKKVVITIDADGKAVTEELTAESEDFSKFSAKKNIMGQEITITVEEVKEA